MNEQITAPVDVKHSFIADTSPVGTFVFSVLCYAFWAYDIGLLGEGAVLGIGFLQFGVFLTYMASGYTLALKGQMVGANTYFLFGTCFGGIGGLFNVFGPLFGLWGIPLDYSLFGIPLTMAGIYLFCLLPVVKYASKVDFLVFFFGGIGVTGSGLTILGILPPWFNFINGWALFLDGTVGFYSVIATVLAHCGVIIPVGKPFFRPAAATA